MRRVGADCGGGVEARGVEGPGARIAAAAGTLRGVVVGVGVARHFVGGNGKGCLSPRLGYLEKFWSLVVDRLLLL